MNMLMGRYIPGNSVIHKMDPRSKLLVIIAFIAVIFLAHDWFGYALLLVYTFLGVWLSKIPITYFLKGLRPMIGIILFTVIFQMLFTPGSHVIFHFWIFQLSIESMINAVYIFFRFVLIIFMSTILTLTTPPLTLADGIETGLSPLKKIKVPVHELGLMLSISLRFIPTLMDDTTMIMNAQKARGMDFGEGNLLQKIKSVIPILIPLFVSSFRRADDLAIAMESRGYQGGDGRTKYRQLKWRTCDSWLILSIIAVAGLLILWTKFVQ
ncbi:MULTISPECIES: energy-coupling factor transporter transmembrane protein EcfT [unclassified Lactococcus]|uniref:energy-coupling factor transporter transmembrane component T family protein n=1 Tax=unclassified Lactococcus TaxID=2643510 RepID=UPI0011CC39F3|nr:MULTISPECIES: energy-coupling factor transporter transmembrane protein EcfT [unclassified Lactococcus]MQW22931.1 cobalt ABC transporter ATP-binding protein [Lactococcus sp. dk101]TXK44522.1 energy-coupling factor transporter transmembrane protein EcfT [Lactococcus sp. dk310]TXK50375.1 energy-coupling factor transporter transmembrane protein EcfT [Lactococcus sp. dk322]